MMPIPYNLPPINLLSLLLILFILAVYDNGSIGATENGRGSSDVSRGGGSGDSTLLLNSYISNMMTK